MLLIFPLMIIAIVLLVLYQKKQTNGTTGISFDLSAGTDAPITEDQKNKVVNVTLTGGIIGLFVHSPQFALNRKLKEENANGWVAVQIMPASGGNIFLNILRFAMLVLTLFLYTTSGGYYIIMERKS